LTDDVDALMEALKPGNTSSWTEYGTVSPDKAGTVTDEPEYDESPKDVGYDGLSVYPRFAMPKDPSADAYSAVWDFVDGLNLPYGVDMFNDENMRVIASRDAAEVWKAMKDELLSADVPQLVAVVLPEMYIYEPGFYVFRLPADNITGRNQAIFWSAERSGDVYSMYHRGYYVTSADLDRQIFIDDSGNLTGAVSGDEYISVAAYFADGVYRPVITAAATSHDLEILRGLPAEPSPDVRPISPDIRPISPDIRPTSPDIRPTSPDIRPTSPDIRPTSPDIRPTSPDVRPISPDVRPTSPDVTPNSARPTKPGINVQDKASSLRDIFSRPGSIVAELPESSAGASRTVSDLPASQLTAITEQGREVAVVLPEITVETAAIYVFGVSLDNLPPGDTIFLDMTLTSVSAGSVNASANYEGDYAFLDDDGNEVYTVPANRHVNVAAYLEPNYVYSPAITTSRNSSEGDNVIGLASSSGGCSAGFGGVILLAGLALISRKKH
ncbi:MAG: SYNERG-CTERM sorting domain-containing protein, partial [Synergistaceae bacterium]|nr:SYNERG-CTERM sorting domain-containing protein [Synergistaceae bacterium]